MLICHNCLHCQKIVVVVSVTHYWDVLCAKRLYNWALSCLLSVPDTFLSWNMQSLWRHGNLILVIAWYASSIVGRLVRQYFFAKAISDSIITLARTLHPHAERSQEQKIKCIVHYFERIFLCMPTGFVSFERKVLPLKQSCHGISYPEAGFWRKSTVSLCPFEVKLKIAFQTLAFMSKSIKKLYYHFPWFS